MVDTSKASVQGVMVQTVQEETAATAPEVTNTTDYYRFDHWDTDFSNVQANITVTAIFDSPPLILFDTNDLVATNWKRKIYTEWYTPLFPDQGLYHEENDGTLQRCTTYLWAEGEKTVYHHNDFTKAYYNPVSILPGRDMINDPTGEYLYPGAEYDNIPIYQWRGRTLACWYLMTLKGVDRGRGFSYESRRREESIDSGTFTPIVNTYSGTNIADYKIKTVYIRADALTPVETVYGELEDGYMFYALRSPYPA